MLLLEPGRNSVTQVLISGLRVFGDEMLIKGTKNDQHLVTAMASPGTVTTRGAEDT